MSTARLLALTALLPLTVACQTAFAAQGGGTPKVQSAGLFPPATRAIEVRVSESSTDSLAYLLDQLGASSGVSFTASLQTRQLLEATRTGVGANVSVPADEAWLWVGGLLAHQGLSMGVVSTRAPQLIAIYAPPNRDPSSRVPFEVAEADFGLLAEHPALLVQTTIELPYTDVRQLSNSMRALNNDQNALSMIPAGTTNSMVLMGRAREVVQTTSLLRQIDELAGKPAKQAATGQQTSGPGGG